MATQAQKKHRRTHGSPGVVVPLYSFRSVVIAIVSILCLAGMMVVDSWVLQSGEQRSPKRFFTDPDELSPSLIQEFDAVFVLGGGAPSALEEPPLYVQKRADDAAKIVRRYQQSSGGGLASLPVLCLSAGTAHVPQLLSPNGFPIWESTSTAAYLAKKHQLTDNVYVETTSYDTIGNAFFARTSHTDVNGWRNLLIITNEFHMARTAAIFDWIFSGCSSEQQRGNTYKLYYLLSPNVGLTPEAIEARRQREMESTRNIEENLAKKYTTMSNVWKFLNNEHSLYTASSLIQRSLGSVPDSVASDLVRKSYGLNH